MRTAAKIFTILKMIFFVAYGVILTAVVAPIGSLWLAIAIFVDIACIIGIIISVCALGELNKNYQKPSVAISILTLLFSNLVGGILMLCINDECDYILIRKQPTKCPRCGKHGNDIKLYDIKLSTGCVKLHLCPECASNDSRVSL